jgi:hypothetical protein
MKEFSTRHLESKKSTSYSLWISFRSRNSFFGRQSRSNNMANEAAEGDITYVPDYIKMDLVPSTVLLRQILWYSNGRLCEQRIFS